MRVEPEAARLIAGIIHRHGSIELPAAGNSMFPLIRDGNVCRFVSVRGRELRKGDILLVHLNDGRLIAHRVHRVNRVGTDRWYLLRGDTNYGFDEPVTENRILGRLTQVHKTGLTVDASGLLFRAWGRLILGVPLITISIRGWLNKKAGY